MQDYANLAIKIIENPKTFDKIVESRGDYLGNNVNYSFLYLELKSLKEYLERRGDLKHNNEINNVLRKLVDLIEMKEQIFNTEDEWPENDEWEDEEYRGLLDWNEDRYTEELEEEEEFQKMQEIEAEEYAEELEQEEEEEEEEFQNMLEIEDEEYAEELELEEEEKYEEECEEEYVKPQSTESWDNSTSGGFEFNDEFDFNKNEYNVLFTTEEGQKILKLTIDELQNKVLENDKTISKNNQIIRKALIQKILKQQNTIKAQQEEINHLIG